MLSGNEFERNIGAFVNTAGAIALSCYYNITHSDNSIEGESIFHFDGFEEGAIPVIFNSQVDKELFKQRSIGKYLFIHTSHDSNSFRF